MPSSRSMAALRCVLDFRPYRMKDWIVSETVVATAVPSAAQIDSNSNARRGGVWSFAAAVKMVYIWYLSIDSEGCHEAHQ